MYVGCQHLLQCTQRQVQLVQPPLHLFGHISRSIISHYIMLYSIIIHYPMISYISYIP
jgi:hypothetical protein